MILSYLLMSFLIGRVRVNVRVREWGTADRATTCAFSLHNWRAAIALTLTSAHCSREHCYSLPVTSSNQRVSYVAHTHKTHEHVKSRSHQLYCYCKLTCTRTTYCTYVTVYCTGTLSYRYICYSVCTGTLSMYKARGVKKNSRSARNYITFFFVSLQLLNSKSTPDENRMQRVPLHRHRVASPGTLEIFTPTFGRCIPRHLLGSGTALVESNQMEWNELSDTARHGARERRVDRRTGRLRPHARRRWVARPIRAPVERARVHSGVASNGGAVAHVRQLQHRAYSPTIRSVRLFWGASIWHEYYEKSLRRARPFELMVFMCEYEGRLESRSVPIIEYGIVLHQPSTLPCHLVTVQAFNYANATLVHKYLREVQFFPS